IEATPMDHPCCPSRHIRSKEDRRPKNAFECRDESAILFATIRHAKRIQHLSTGPESDGLALLSNRESCLENRNDPVLPKWHSMLWVPGYLKKKLPVPASIKKLACGKPPEWESTENERPGTETERLVRFISLQPDQVPLSRPFDQLFGNDEFRMEAPQDR